MTQIANGRPAVSVLVLTYNHKEYIRQALDSVLSQKFGAGFEVLIGDDCSTDGTREIALEYEARFPNIVKVFTHRCNIGMHANHSFLVDRARGDYVAYCEGDDYWTDPCKLRRQWEYLEAHPECGLIHGNYMHLIQIAGAWRVRTAFRRNRDLARRSGRLYEQMLQSNRIQTCTVMCRRVQLEKCRNSGIDVDAYKVVDWPYFLHISHESAIGFIEIPLAAYRRTPGSVTNSGAQSAVTRGLDAIRMVDDFCDYFGDFEQVRHRALAAQHRTQLFLAFLASDQMQFERSRKWLELNAHKSLRTWRVRGMQILLRWPQACRFWLWVLTVVRQGKNRLEFRIEDSRS